MHSVAITNTVGIMHGRIEFHEQKLLSVNGTFGFVIKYEMLNWKKSIIEG